MLSARESRAGGRRGGGLPAVLAASSLAMVLLFSARLPPRPVASALRRSAGPSRSAGFFTARIKGRPGLTRRVCGSAESRGAGPREYVCRNGRILRNPVHLNVTHTKAKTVRDFGGDGAIEKYMKLPVEQYNMLNETLICRNPLTPEKFILMVPKLTIFNVWIQPKVEVTVQTLDDRVVLTASNCEIDGSELVTRMGLDNRFEFEATSQMKWDSDGEKAEVTMDGSLNVWCEKLPPFKLMPTRVLQGASNAVLGTAVRTIQRIFMDNLMADYEKWATSPTYREERAQTASSSFEASTGVTTVK